ncbi:MFS transporter [Acinetobacter kyonggiensis]|uniref:Predicted arabinose efflux permease, MFS family n=1 Tax=Acinetobacter kyonggiensis TaxID=595670 RepID=A0A1H3GAZ8_9GAMM|nr:MFS transporter [Acinetobacter kyonggiensis]SDY00227.1 Predicted arabinose efflux permease, MFS family [Acinetobacter kyonggiensis]
MSSPQEKQNHVEPPAYWSGIFAMTLCVFALIASEFMPVSLLTPIAVDLTITEGMVGQGIAISGAFAVMTSLTISRLAGGINRKTLLLILTAIMAVSGAIVALAQSYTVYMIGRALIGMVIGGFWSMSAAMAMRLVPSVQVPRALAIFNSGNALAMVIAAPLGSYLGSIIGWRGAFFSLVPVAILAFIWQWISLPSMPVTSEPAEKRPSIVGLLRNPVVMIGMLAVSLFFMGQFSLYTYVRPFLETITQVNISTLSLILLGIGVMGFIGTSVINTFLKRGFYTTLITIPIMMAVIAVTLIFLGTWPMVVAVLLGIWGFLGTAAPVGWWSWLARTLPNDAEAGGGLMVAVVQLAIALGSTLGGVLFDHSGYQVTFVVSAIILVISSILTSRLTTK